MRKRISKILSLLMVFVFCITSQAVLVFAEELTNMTVQVDSVSGTPGETVYVKINLDKNPGVSSLKFKVNYDDDVLTLTNVEFNSEFGTYVTAPTPYKNPQTISMVSPLQDVSVNGNFATLTFIISEDAPDNYVADISLSYDPDDICDTNLENVDVNVVNGSVKVFVGIPGDINKDKKVNNKDAMLLFRYVAGWEDLDVDYGALDVNGDGKINNKDALTLFRYAAGWEGITLTRGIVCSHRLVATERKDATCTEDGNIAYWQCSECGAIFDSENATHQIVLIDTVIPAKGHNIVIDPAVPATETNPGLTEGSHCTICDYRVEQEVIPQLVVETYNITYNVSNNDTYIASVNIDNPNQHYYTSAGLTLKNISCPGYNFLGWYDLPSGSNAEIVKKIPAGETGDIELYAHWEKIEYTIQFESDLIPVNEMKYTTDRGALLPTPQLDGYIFTGWSDNDGNVLKSIPVGTTGNLKYTANWLSERNKAWTKKKIDEPIIIEDSDTNSILFTYEIGKIENVPLYTVEDFGYINSDGVSREITKTYTVKTEKTLMEQYAKNVANATTNSAQWSLSNSWSDAVTVNENYLKENDLTETTAKEICTTDSSNWLVSSGSSGSTTTTTYNSSQDYNLNTDTSNTKTYNTSDETDSTTHKQSAELDLTSKEYVEVSGGANIGVGKIEGKAGIELTQELDIGYEGSHTGSVASKTGTEGDEGKNTQTGSVGHSGSDTVSTGSWNSSKSYGGSKTVSESDSTSKTISERISSQYGYGKSYVQAGDASSAQGLTTSSSTSDTYSSTVTYNSSETTTESISYTTSNTKTGYHRLVKAGTAHVFAVVGYDIKTASYFTTTYTVMDDEVHNFEDYSYSSANYDDNQSSVIPFEIPYFVEEYVLTKVGETDGLEVSAAGVVTGYTGTEKTVIIPEYHVVDNHDGTKKVVKITGISTNAFRNNTEITGIELSDFITEIPENAFNGCTNLSLVKMAGVTSIGDNAFVNCPQIDYIFLSDQITHLGSNTFENMKSVIVCASNADVVNGAITCGADVLMICVSEKCTDLNDLSLSIPDSIDYFIFNGYGRTYNDLYISSDAANTVINRASFVSTSRIPLTISSGCVLLNQVTISTPGIAIALTADECDLELYGESSLSSTNGDTALCKAVNISRIGNDLTTLLHVNGNILSFDSSQSLGTGENALLELNDGSIIYISEDEYTKYLNGVVIISFDANEGVVSETDKIVYYGSAIGELPSPTRDYYNFVGWYTAKDGGEKVTADTIMSDFNNMTLYAHWNQNGESDWVLESAVPEGGAITNTKWTYTLREFTTSSSSSKSGWIYDSKTRTGWGSTQGPVYSDPSNGSRNVWSESYVTSSNYKTVYKYYRYAVNYTGGYGSYTQSGSYPNYYEYAFDSPLASNGTSGGHTKYQYWYSSSNWISVYDQWTEQQWVSDNYGTRWYYQEPVYTYSFHRDLDKEATSDPTGQSNVSNVVKYVKYRAK